MVINKVFFFALFFPLICISQTLIGRVLDKATQQPLETVSIYFDNTTVGTTTNSNGEFSITYSDAIQSVLVISYLGYEKVLISDFRTKTYLDIELVEAVSELEEVLISYDDGLTRRQKLRLFRKEFLGSSKFGKSCRILNEEDLVLNYDKKDKILYADSKVPVVIENKLLQYKIDFEIQDFEIEFNYVDADNNDFSIDKVVYTGTSFYADLKNANKKRVLKNRVNVYEGSIQHFMKALYHKDLRDRGYWIFHKRFRVEEWDFFMVEELEDSRFKKVTLKNKVSILYNKELQSELQLAVEEFYIDSFGHYLPIQGVYFSGAMGSQRIGDTLPLDYDLKE